MPHNFTRTGAVIEAIHDKVDAIEAGATADQTGAEIKVAYEAEADTNAYTDAEKTKLAGVATGADVTSANETSHADVLVDADIGVNVAAQGHNHAGTYEPANVNIQTHVVAAHAPSNADNTAANETSHADVLVDGDVGISVAAEGHTHGQLHDEAHTVASHSDTTATGPELDELTGGGLTALHSHSGGGGGDMLAATYDPTTVAGDAFDMDNMVEGAATKILTGTERTKLAGIEDSATADQTGGEIKTAYELEADTNAYTDAEKTKLAGVATGADVTSANETSHADVLVDADIGVNVAAQGHNHAGTYEPANANIQAHVVSAHAPSNADNTAANETSHADVLVDGDVGVTVQGYDADTAKTDIAQEFSAAQNFNATTLSDGATISWDLAANQACSVTLAGNRTMAAPTNLKDGATYALKVIQDATGSRTITWNSVFKWAGGTAPTLSTGANAVDMIFFYSDGTNLYGSAQLDFS